MKNILLGLLVVVALAVVFVATRPGTFHVERSMTMAAAPAAVYSRIADFRQWKAWSPWEKLDPQMKTDFGGADAGVGATYHWVGNNGVGEGRMTVTEAEPSSKVGIKLEFVKPFAATNACTFTLSPDAAGTRVTWAMDGTNNFMAKTMSVFMSMDKMIGPDFDRGLASIKVLTEASAAGAPADTTVGHP